MSTTAATVSTPASLGKAGASGENQRQDRDLHGAHIDALYLLDAAPWHLDTEFYLTILSVHFTQRQFPQKRLAGLIASPQEDGFRKSVLEPVQRVVSEE
jgi:hypothetical protein